ncbi:50S ribosomal protein L13 [bacterium]|nr:50S ribosomal protein L13 [bacterium]
MKSQKSFYPKQEDLGLNKWVIVDAEGLVLGRIASFVASVVRGKHKPTYTPSADMGDNVIVINADKVAVTGNKPASKMYHRHSGYPGGLKSTVYKDMAPVRILEIAINGMLPKTKLGAKLQKKVKIYAGAEHPHAAQEPEVLTVGKKEI